MSRNQPIHDRYAIVFRVQLVGQVIRDSHFGLTAAEATKEVSEVGGDTFSKRTIQRDLRVLETLSLIEEVKEEMGHRLNRSRWKWIGAAASVIESLALTPEANQQTKRPLRAKNSRGN